MDVLLQPLVVLGLILSLIGILITGYLLITRLQLAKRLRILESKASTLPGSWSDYNRRQLKKAVEIVRELSGLPISHLSGFPKLEYLRDNELLLLRRVSVADDGGTPRSSDSSPPSVSLDESLVRTENQREMAKVAARPPTADKRERSPKSAEEIREILEVAESKLDWGHHGELVVRLTEKMRADKEERQPGLHLVDRSA